jgi:hypothetical protein
MPTKPKSIPAVDRAKPSADVLRIMGTSIAAASVVGRLIAAGQDVVDQEAIEGPVWTFWKTSTSPETQKALAKADLERCRKLFVLLDREHTPSITDEIADELVPLLVWLEAACNDGVLTKTTPDLADAGRSLLRSLEWMRYDDPMPKPSPTSGARGEITRPTRTSYLPPSRDGKKAVVAYIDPKLAKGLKSVAGMHGQSVQEYLAELIEKDLAAKQSPKYLEQLVKRMAKRLGPTQS